MNTYSHGNTLKTSFNGSGSNLRQPVNITNLLYKQVSPFLAV